jgi:hypothetical protein
MGIDNEAVKSHMVSLFGEEQLAMIRRECQDKFPAEREMIVIQELCNTLKNSGSRYVLPFRFKNDEGTRTSHHLIFLSKDFRGYDIMKDIMYKESSNKEGEVASFEYNPRDMRYRQGSLFDLLSLHLEDLQDMLLRDYSAQTIDFNRLYENHSVDKPFVRKNYKDVLKILLENGKISAVNRKTGKPPKKGTFSDEMRITFGGAS